MMENLNCSMRVVHAIAAVGLIAVLVFLKTDGSSGRQPAGAGGPATGPASGPSERCPLRLSEVKLDGADGSDDWWVELCNTSNHAASATGVTIVVNGKILASIAPPEAGKNLQPTMVPARGLLLIQVDMKDDSSAEWTITTRPKSRRTPTVTVVPPVAETPRPPERQPEYCALFASADLTKDSMVDYVQWGRPPDRKESLDYPHSKWAVDSGLWPAGNGIRIDLSPPPGEKGAPPAGSSVCRHQFVGPAFGPKIGSELWIVCPPKYTTPGAFNVVPPPVIASPFGGHASDGPLNISFVWLDIPRVIAYDSSKEKPYHFQIAKDAMFEEVVFDTRYGDGPASIPQRQLKDGAYWARVRYDSPKLSTGWSDAKAFTYR